MTTEKRIDVYGTTAPKASQFGVGATNLAEINEATAARRELSREQSTATRGPVQRD